MRELSSRSPWFLGIGAVVLFCSALGSAAQPLPAVEVILGQVVERSEKHRGGDGPVYYLCTKQTVTEELDSTGRVIARKVKVRESRTEPSGSSAADKWGSKNGISINRELLQRYRFTLVRREFVSGRSTFRLEFAPKQPPPPVRQFQDRLLNRTEGTVWVDEQDHELVKARFYLAEPVTFGVLGGIEALNFSFERFRGQDGGWLNSWTDTYFKGRKLLKLVQTKKRVDWRDHKKFEEPAERSAMTGG